MIKHFIAASILAIHLSGCSAYMAANQPGQKDIGLFDKGQPRAKLIAEFGSPINTEIGQDGRRRDIFKFKQGYHGAVRAGRAILHGTATVATLGLWEIVGTPAEGYMNGTELSAEVIYDAEDKVASVTPLTGEDELRRGIKPGAIAGTGGAGTNSGSVTTSSVTQDRPPPVERPPYQGSTPSEPPPYGEPYQTGAIQRPAP